MTDGRDTGASTHREDSMESHPGHNKEQAENDFSDCFSKTFRKVWPDITSDNYLTLFGFRRYRTTHLLNLRFLEFEIDKIDHDLYQAGLQLERPLGREHALDRLGLKQAKRDDKQIKMEEIVNQALILRLRSLIKEYGDYIVNVAMKIS